MKKTVQVTLTIPADQLLNVGHHVLCKAAEMVDRVESTKAQREAMLDVVDQLQAAYDEMIAKEV